VKSIAKCRGDEAWQAQVNKSTEGSQHERIKRREMIVDSWSGQGEAIPRPNAQSSHPHPIMQGWGTLEPVLHALHAVT
jgi:hypothetical protein